MIRQGRVNVMKSGSTVEKLKEGDYFGERALIRDDIQTSTFFADGTVVCYTLSRDAFNKLLGPIETLWRYETLKKVFHFSRRFFDMLLGSRFLQSQ